MNECLSHKLQQSSHRMELQGLSCLHLQLTMVCATGEDYRNHRIFPVGRDPPGSLNSTLKVNGLYRDSPLRY